MLTPYHLFMLLDAGLFAAGLVTFATGVVILAVRASSGDIKALVAQTAHLAQKGLAEDVAGVLGNASDLIDAMNQLVRTQRGVGIFLVLAGMIMMALACWLALLIFQSQS